MNNRCGEPGCNKRRHSQSDLCPEHITERRLREHAKKAGARIAKNKDGTLTVVEVSRLAKIKRGKNVRAIAELRAWIRKADKDAEKRFSGQLAIAESIAVEIDNDNTSNASTYRALLDNIYRRVDTIYGTENLDIISRMQRMIDENVKERVKKGWG